MWEASESLLISEMMLYVIIFVYFSWNVYLLYNVRGEIDK